LATMRFCSVSGGNGNTDLSNMPMRCFARCFCFGDVNNQISAYWSKVI